MYVCMCGGCLWWGASVCVCVCVCVCASGGVLGGRRRRGGGGGRRRGAADAGDRGALVGRAVRVVRLVPRPGAGRVVGDGGLGRRVGAAPPAAGRRPPVLRRSRLRGGGHVRGHGVGRRRRRGRRRGHGRRTRG